MEFMGFQQALAFLLGTTMLVKAFISDRHSQIAKWMRDECPQKCKDLGKPVIDHFFDLWHIGKSNLPYFGLRDLIVVVRDCHTLSHTFPPIFDRDPKSTN